MHIALQWWSPMVGAIEEKAKPNSTWVRIVGLPLHLLSHKSFKAIGEFCGGWIETEEETQLRNHPKWARIKILGDGTSIPEEVTIESGGFFFTTQIWAEAPVRFHVGEGEGEEVQVFGPTDIEGKHKG